MHGEVGLEDLAIDVLLFQKYRAIRADVNTKGDFEEVLQSVVTEAADCFRGTAQGQVVRVQWPHEEEAVRFGHEVVSLDDDLSVRCQHHLHKT